ncbi:hypothetical protein B0J11DRAFT_513186 [Dendryphion nanum]|uniref:Uncharacterized protein n=1 Tax=Dendryphion nanum TaxID=256645 RepID=A0A9P9J1G1_9PLEO|nr:hypothetical protein B0J11DRAFT_513186 [Dendryphion nanum]
MIYTSRAWVTTLRRIHTAQAQAQAQTSPHPFHPLTIRRGNSTTSTSQQPQPQPHHSQCSINNTSSESSSPSSRSVKSTLPNHSQSSIASFSPLPSTQTSPSSPKTIPGPSWLWLEPVYEPFRAYGRVQRRRPYLTQFASALVIYFVGDLGDINGEEEDEEVGWVQEWANGRDWNRTGRALLIGGLAAVPGYRWFLWLSNSFNYSSKVLSLTTKVTVNQILFTPIFNSYFFGMQYLLSPPPPHPHNSSSTEPPHHSLHDLVERLKATVPVSWVNSCKIWPVVTAFSFSFIPIEYRSIFGGVIAIGWQTYLSILNRRAEEAQMEHEESIERVKAVVREVRLERSVNTDEREKCAV